GTTWGGVAASDPGERPGKVRSLNPAAPGLPRAGGIPSAESVAPPEALMQRRAFLSRSLAAMQAAGAAPRALTARDKSGTKNAIVGSGEHRYECIHDWGTLPKNLRWETT